METPSFTYYPFEEKGYKNRKLERFFNYCKNVEQPYTHFSTFSYIVSLILTIVYSYACHYYVIKINCGDFIWYVMYISNIFCLICLFLTRPTVTIKHHRIRRNFYGVLRDTCEINSFTLYIYIAHHIFLWFSINTLYYIAYFCKISEEYSDQFLFLIRCISVYFYIVHRILRPAHRDDVLRTFLELELPEICMDYFDSSELLSIYVLSLKDTIQFVDFGICIIWNSSIFLRFIYLTLIHFPYNFNNLWTHLGFDFSDKLSTQGYELYRFHVTLKLRIFLLIPMLLADVLSLIFRIFVMVFLDLDQKDFIFALIFKNIICIYRTISAIFDYRNSSKNNVDSNNLNGKNLSCFRKIKLCLYRHLTDNLYFYFITFFLIVFLILKAFVQYLFWILDLWWTFIILIIDLSVFSALFFNTLSYMTQTHYEFHYLKVNELMGVIYYVLLCIALIYNPILYLTLKRLPTQIPFMNLSPQNAVWLIMIEYFILFFSASTLIKFGKSLDSKKFDGNRKHGVKDGVKEVVSMLFQTSLSSECIMDYMSSVIFFLSFNQDFSLTLKIFIIVILILEQYLGALILLIISENPGPGYHLHSILKQQQFTIKIVRIISDSLGFTIRMVLLFDYRYDSNVFIFKSLCRILHCFAVLEREILKYHDNGGYERISSESVSCLQTNDYRVFNNIYNSTRKEKFIRKYLDW